MRPVRAVPDLTASWPGQARTIWGDHERFKDVLLDLPRQVLHRRRLSAAAVAGYPHDVKGQGIWCYVTLKAGE